MFRKAFTKVLVLTVLFVLSCAATMLAIQKWKKNSIKEIPEELIQQNSTLERRAAPPITGDYSEEIKGVVPGQIVPLPTLPSLKGDIVELSNLREDYLLCGFISSRCYNCSLDREFWSDLNQEAAKRKVAFYLINVGSDEKGSDDIKKFAETMDFNHVPVLYDPDDKAIRLFSVGAAPQYVLLTAKGQVIARWDGVRSYKKSVTPEKITQFFERIPDR